MAETPWLDLPFMSLTRENVRAEAARRGLSFRELMGLYYRQDSQRATHLSMYWRVAPDHPRKLFGKSRVGQFVGDLRGFLAEAGVRLTVTRGDDPHGLDKLRALKEERQARDLQEQRLQQGPGPSKPRKRKRGGDRKAKNARRRPRQARTTPVEALPPPNESVRYDDGDGNVYKFTAGGVRLEKAARPPAKRARKQARRSPSTSASSSSASSSSSSSSSSSASSGSSTSSSSSSTSYSWLFAFSSSSSSSDSSSSSEDDNPSRAKPSAPAKGGGAVPAAEAASPPPEIEVIYSKPPERVSEERWVAAFCRAQPVEEEEETQLGS